MTFFEESTVTSPLQSHQILFSGVLSGIGVSHVSLNQKGMPRNNNPAEQFFQELLPYVEKLDAQIGALVQIPKDK